MAEDTEIAVNELTQQDYNDIWYLVDYYGSKMWPAEKLARLRVLIKQAEKSLAE